MRSLDSVVAQLAAAGHPTLPDGHPVADGKVHRYGKQKKYWYALHEVSRMDGSRSYAGAYGYWRGTDNGAERFQWEGSPMTQDERDALQRREREAAEKEAEQKAASAQRAATRARQQWTSANKEGHSPYLERKRITAETVRFDADGQILVPMLRYDTGDLVGLQKITPDGAKRFNKGVGKRAAACRLGDLGADDRIALVTEGYATARSVRMSTDDSVPVFVCFDAGNLAPAAAAIRARHPDLHLLFCADDDWMIERRLRDEVSERFGLADSLPLDGAAVNGTHAGVDYQLAALKKLDRHGVAFLELTVATAHAERTVRFENAGLKYAYEAAAQVGNASVVSPRFSNRGERGLTDFNDLHVEQGLEAVKTQVAAAILSALVPEAVRARVAADTVKPSPEAAADEGEIVENGAYTWQQDLKRAEKSRAVLPTLDNVFLILENDEAWAGIIAFEEFASRVMKRKAPPFIGGEEGEWTDMDDARCALWLAQRYGFNARSDVIISAVQLAADRHRYHVVREYLRELKWDGRKRVSDGWLSRYLSVPDTEYTRSVGYKWPIAAVARVMEPGCKVDNVLILEGDQGVGKSTALRILAGDAWFTDAQMVIGDKDTYVVMVGKWIIELGELDALSKAESSATKRFFSSSHDTYRPPYGRRAIDVPRQGVFAGSVNFDSYLKDESGNRRYWPVKVERPVDLEALALNRDQIWAEAYHLYERWHEQNRLSGGNTPRPWAVLSHERQLFEIEQDARYEGDIYETMIGEHVVGLTTITMREIFENCLRLETSKWTPAEQRRVGKALKALGWIRKRQSTGRRDWYYECPPDRPSPIATTSTSETDDAPL
ncbi:VapE domain-containing protein [Chitinasiproducens palmae]|uniref:Predicted P-loop ATPase and inactivated derivatives n=1 Tax=Chitinasiproducens palmae TaxID=1770053 RepID=A0A1H2PMW1_9BURK|nr:VapE domain-containing protein [Chitinasiproducens palmae]SDV47928.1 Predicted P-loop ATPase and inactivated derivatives [Chitinasiproducens palmae]